MSADHFKVIKTAEQSSNVIFFTKKYLEIITSSTSTCNWVNTPNNGNCLNEFIVHLNCFSDIGNTHLIGLTTKFIIDDIATHKYIYDFSLYCKFECADGEYWNKDSNACVVKNGCADN